MRDTKDSTRADKGAIIKKNALQTAATPARGSNEGTNAIGTGREGTDEINKRKKSESGQDRITHYLPLL